MKDTANNKGKFSWRVVIWAVIAVVIIVLGVMRLSKKGTHRPNNIILISIDTIRADRLSCYGYKHRTTPNIDAFTKEAVLFENCFADVPLTMPSHASMLTGLIPPAHGVHDNSKMALADSVLTLPEILKEKGYATYGIVSAAVLDRKYGLNQGFNFYDDSFDDEMAEAQYSITQRTGDETVGRAMKWLDENRDKKNFMFVHFYDPHRDYTPPEPYDKQFKDPYDGEIAFTDYCVGQILDRLKSLGLYDNSFIVITGDNGEMLGEHDEHTHGFFIYNNVLRVPLIIKPAGQRKSFRVADNTTLTDIMPTILAQDGIEIPSVVQGVNLSDYFTLSNHRITDRFIYNESLVPTKYNGNSLLGVINNQWHYIQTTRPELYDFIADPCEVNNLITAEPKRADYLRKHLRRIIDDAASDQNDLLAALSDKSLQALRSLGYVSGTVDTDLTFDRDRSDPKDLVKIHNDIAYAGTIGFYEKYDEVIKICERIIRQYPDIAPTYEVLAHIYLKLESYDKAAELLQKQIALLPDDDIRVLNILAGTYTRGENYTKAIDTINTILERQPNAPWAYYYLAKNYHHLNDTANVLRNSVKALQQDPANLAARLLTANTYYELGELEQAVEQYEIIVKQKPDVKTYRRVSDIYAKLKSYDKAVGILQEALVIQPDNAFALNSLAWYQATLKDSNVYNPQSALVNAKKAVELFIDKNSAGHQHYPSFLDTLAAAQAANGQFDAAIETAEQALMLCRQKELTSLTSEIQKHLDLYKQRKAYSE